MPPNIVKSIKDEIYWQYCKLISKAAGFGIESRAFQMHTFIKLRDGKIKWSSTIGEWVLENEKSNECIYCGAKEKLTVEHILPTCRNGPDNPDNAIRVCKKCNSSKGGKRLYEWIGFDHKDKVPRIAEGKYLKLIYTLHEKAGTLNMHKNQLRFELCPKCDMDDKCTVEGHRYKLTVYCLEGMFTKNK